MTASELETILQIICPYSLYSALANRKFPYLHMEYFILHNRAKKAYFKSDRIGKLNTTQLDFLVKTITKTVTLKVIQPCPRSQEQ